MQSFRNSDGRVIVDNLVAAIQENKQYLSDIDGAIGDGDHGINMNKGFTLCAEQLDGGSDDLTHCLQTLSKVLLTSIGGSMGPLYGFLFRSMAKACDGREEIDAACFGEMLRAAEKGVGTISKAKPGDKTLIDVLAPAVAAYAEAVEKGKSFGDSLSAMQTAAETGRDSTVDMMAKIGRASRLGERSRGVVDPGAASCALILTTMAESIRALIDGSR